MRWKSVGALSLISMTVLAGCATPSGGTPADVASPAAVENTVPPEQAAAELQVQSWLDAAVLPDGAVPSETSSVDFLSTYGWPCTPVATAVAYWTIPGARADETVNWLADHPTADLIVPFAPHAEPGRAEGVSVGQIPRPDAQEGIVYTVRSTPDGVAIRAQIAAMYETATCPTYADGGQMGGVGQG